MGLYERLRIDESTTGKQQGGQRQLGASFVLRCGDGRKRRFAVCQCGCGHIRVVDVSQYRPRCEKCRSITHGTSKHQNRKVWEGMIDRCTKPQQTGYKRYGGRGIRVCDRWLNSFEAFCEDMGVRPSAQHEIDRIDNDGNYEPGNCRWVSRSENQRNKSNTRKLLYRGQVMTLYQIRELTGVSIYALQYRVRRGMNIEEAANPGDRRKRTLA